MTTAFIWDERFAWHDAGRASQCPWVEPYPALDRPETKRRLQSLLAASGLLDELTSIPARAATREELLRFHTAEYVDRIRALSAGDGGDAGESARFGPGGFDLASLAAGACIEAVDAVLSGRAHNAYALVRPCGHHAEAARGRGFCVFGNAALAVKHAQAIHGLERIAVVDWDVHHGNGTEDAFYQDRSVLTISLHQDGCYPADRGGVDDIGRDAGLGSNLNVPLPPGTGHGGYLEAFERVVVPAISAFDPELILISAGYDAAVNDPLGRMLCHSETYREMTRQVGTLARSYCSGRLVICHEGGYSPTYVPFCGLAVIEELAGTRTDVADPYLGWYSNLGGQQLQPHQSVAIERAATHAADLAIRHGPSLRRTAS